MILEAKIRKPKNTHLLREEGILPAVIYGAGVESTPIAIKGTDFISAITKDTDSATMEISIDGTVHHVLLSLCMYILHITLSTWLPLYVCPHGPPCTGQPTSEPPSPSRHSKPTSSCLLLGTLSARPPPWPAK